MEEITEERQDKSCIICKRSTVDELKFGKLYSRQDVTCHFNCLMYVSQLPQDGEDDEGILGFLLPDIRKEIKRVVKDRRNRKFYKCKYCKQEGATVGCCVGKCKALFHFPCGLENGANFIFSNFTVFCKVHSKAPKITRVAKDEECAMCTFSVSKMDPSKLVLGTCCNRKYHRECVQKYALNAGLHAFKCPCCNSLDFVAKMQLQGVYIPDRDASWELEEGAFADQYQDGYCETLPCVCDKGRHYEDEDPDSIWQLVRCHNCGANCTHLKCGQIKEDSLWKCQLCMKLEQEKSGRVKEIR